MVKERETLEILKELETTKKVLDSLKSKIHKEETSESAAPFMRTDSTKVNPIMQIEEHVPKKLENSTTSTKIPSPDLILMELKQAKMNLNRSTSDIVGIHFSIESVHNELQKEKLSLEKARQRVALSSSRISNLENELNHSRFILQLIKDVGTFSSKNPPDISRKLHELRSESEQFKRMGEVVQSEVLKLTSDIEQTRAGIMTAEIRLDAARKMEAAARASESSAKGEIKALTNNENSSASLKKSTGVTLSIEEYNMLVQKAQEAERLSTKRIETAVALVEEATKSKLELLKMVDEVKADVKSRKKTLSEVLIRVEVANRGKLAVEEALRKWRSDNGQRRRSIYNSPRFKNPFPGHNRRDSKARELNSLGLGRNIMDSSKSTLTPTLSIGQILSRKLVGPEDFETISRDSTSTRPKVSLGQMLSRRQGISSSETSGDGVAPQLQFKPKKKRFTLMGFAFILAKRRKKNKNKYRKKKIAWCPK